MTDTISQIQYDTMTVIITITVLHFKSSLSNDPQNEVIPSLKQEPLTK
jgi:hypothetical protein